MAKYLAAELEGGPPLRRWFRDEIARELASGGRGAEADAMRALDDPAAIGALTGDLLQQSLDERTRLAVHTLLRELTDREIDVLAAA
jgi:hypothetical protein